MRFAAFALTAALAVPALAKEYPSPVLPGGQDGKLKYETLARGDRVPDYSHAGYRGGGVPLPLLPAKVQVAPAEGDDGARIQAAIDFVSGLAPDANGHRGAHKDQYTRRDQHAGANTGSKPHQEARQAVVNLASNVWRVPHRKPRQLKRFDRPSRKHETARWHCQPAVSCFAEALSHCRDKLDG